MAIEITALRRKTLNGKPGVKTFKLPEPPGWEAMNPAHRYVYEYGLRQSIQDAAADAKTVADAHASMDARVAQIVAGERPAGREGDPTRRYMVEVVVGAAVATAKDLKGMDVAAILKLVAAKRNQGAADKVASAVARMVELKRIDLE